MTIKHENCPECGGMAIPVATRAGVEAGYRIKCTNSLKNKCIYTGTANYSTREAAFISWDNWAKELK